MMSKETYVGGDIIETTGGNNLSYAKDVIENIGLQVIQDGKTNGVFYGINKDAPTLTTPTVTFAYIAKIVGNHYQQIKWAGVEDEVYVVVRTTGLVGRNIEINILDRDSTIMKGEYSVLNVLQDNLDKKGEYIAKVNEDGLAIFKLEMQPSKVKKDIKIWRDKISASKDKKAYLCILVDAHSQNSDLKVTYMGKNPSTDKTSKKSDKPNYWLDEKGKWFELNNDGTVVVVSGTVTKKEKDAYLPSDFSWIMYKTTVYRNMSLSNYKKLEKSNSLPSPDYTTYLSRDTHQTSTSKGDMLKHSNKRFGQYNEIPPGEYFLVPGIGKQKYLIYVIDSESKSADAANGISGPDGDRGGVALHHYSPNYSVGCFTFNSGKKTKPVQDLIENIPNLPTGDNKPVNFIVKSRNVEESTWKNPAYGTKKWKGI